MRIPIWPGRALEIRATATPGLPLADPALAEWFAGPASATGRTITPETALAVSAVYACVRILAEAVAGLPLIVYRRLPDGGRQRAPDHPLYGLLHDAPNPEMTSFELREALMGHLVLRGNAYAEVERNGAGRPLAIWPLRPDRVTVGRDAEGLLYDYALPSGGTARLRPPRILHLRGLSSDGIVGYSPIRLAREAIGLAAATEEYGARLFAHSGRPSGVIEYPGQLSPEAAARLRDDWESEHGGLSRAHRTAILQEGMSWKQVGIPPEDAQFLATREHQVAEIARVYRIPLHLLASGDKAATYASVEQFGIQFVVHTVRPWLVRWEQGLSRSLFAGDRHYPEHLIDGLLRGDTESRYRAYSTGRTGGWLSADEIRERENMNPLPDGLGRTYWVPLNMMAVGKPERRAAVPEARSRPGRRAARPGQHMPALAAALDRLVGWEVAEIRKLVRRAFGQRDAPVLLADLGAWYEDERTRGRIRRYVAPMFATMAAVVAADLEEELDATLPDGWAAEVASGYADVFVREHASASQAQLRAWAHEQDPADAIAAGLAEWETGRAAEVARGEAVRSANVFARLGMAAAGVSHLLWSATGPAPCPICTDLDGARVSVGDAFGPAIGLRNPPAHAGCVCTIMPGLARNARFVQGPGGMSPKDQLHPDEVKLDLRRKAIAATSRRTLALDLFSGVGTLRRLYKRSFERVVSVEKDPSFGGIDYRMTVTKFIADHLEEHADFDLAEFDDEGCPGVELQDFFARLAEMERRRSFTLCATDGLGLKLKLKETDGTADLDKLYLLGRRAVPEDYDRFESLHTDAVVRIAKRSGFRATLLESIRYSSGNVVASAWRVS